VFRPVRAGLVERRRKMFLVHDDGAEAALPE
jgi:hypothetical protein